jgi:hypothetical protein
MHCSQTHTSLSVAQNVCPVAVKLFQKDARRRTSRPLSRCSLAGLKQTCLSPLTRCKALPRIIVVLALQLMSVRLCLQILLTQQQLMKAKSDEENKGGGAADARRWNGLRNVVESRALLKTAFRTASTLKAQVDRSSALRCWLTML